MSLLAGLRKIWDKYTEGWIGAIIYLALGFVIAFLFNMALGFTLGTETPVVAVFSCSMEHGTINNEFCHLAPNQICGKKIQTDPKTFDEYWSICGDWYESNNFSKGFFESSTFKNGLTVGDMIIVYGKDDISVGDIVVFDTNRKYPIIHRVYKINSDDTISTKGDNNAYPDGWSLTRDDLHGKAVLKIPLLGWVKILFTEITGL